MMDKTPSQNAESPLPPPTQAPAVPTLLDRLHEARQQDVLEANLLEAMRPHMGMLMGSHLRIGGLSRQGG